MSSWGCPHETEGKCMKVTPLPCDPGMKGCVLAGRYVFTSDDDKNVRFREKQQRTAKESPANPTPGDQGA